MFLALALALATTIPGGPATPGVVRGLVRSQSTGTPLALAVVEVVDGPRSLRSVTDSLGMYVLKPVTPGRHVIRATHLDHAPFEVEVLVPPGGDMLVDMSLAVRPVILAPVTAWARPGARLDTMAASASDLSAASMRLLDASPGVAELGLAQAAKGVPGGGDASSPADVLYVRGGAADLKLVLLDGAPVYSPFHVGGLLAPFEPDALGSATLYLGGAPARWDGGLSYVMDLHTRAPRRDAAHSSGALDMVAGRALVDGPLVGGVAYMVAVRGVHGLGAQPLVNGPFPYRYADGLARVDADLGSGRLIQLTGFWNHEAVRLDRTQADPTAFWGNSAASARYQGRIAGADGELMASVGEFDAMLPVGGGHPMRADGTSRRVRLTADFREALGAAQLYWGASYDRLGIHYFGWPLANLDTLLLNSEAGGNALGGYVDGAWQPVPKLRLRAGMRADVFASDPQPRMGPRFAITWVAGSHSTVTLAAGKYHQYVRASETAVASSESDAPPDSTATGAKVPPVRPLSVAEAAHLVLSLDQQLSEVIRIGLEGYYKSFRGLPSAAEGQDARARSSGADLWIRGSSGRVNGWLGYSLAWVWSDQSAADVTELFTGRQLVSAGLGTPVIGHTRLDVRVSYGSGMPFTAVPQPDRPPVTEVSPAPRADMVGTDPGATTVTTVPDDPYLRVDAQLARTFDGQYRGMPFQFTPYLRVMNALDRRDGMFYQFDRARDRQPQAVAALPVMPVVGFSWRF